MDWEKVIQNCHEELLFQTEWIRPGGDALFLLAWKAGEVRVVFVDLLERLPGLGIQEVRQEFLALLFLLQDQSQWGRIFKGRDVLFQWLTLMEAPESSKRVLVSAGVEPLFFLDFWEKM